ncbi:MULTISPECIES: beta-class carbonic anhydrase [Metabacillus]|uniref:carbonic anhydrase n=2 Tax=Metabacillus TaxID=2675233 RepID=A0A179T8I3_9BACI|nr:MULTISPECIES: carbonic anhydrase [Metabacillus]OAS88682.1 carbonic anhydrase [Metabacillus litoralis]QNF26597.1 carbonic anhydrase [Metabacillus sp. KUDC1714]
MRIVDEILVHNEKFVANKEFEQFETTKFPEKKLVILSCMDTRLVELLPKAMNIRNGDVKHVKSAGAIVAHPFGSIMRSILVAVYELNADEICVIGHHDCGMSKLNANSFLGHAVERGISEETIETLKYSGIDLDRWLKGFDKVEDSVRDSVERIKNHPLLAENIPVHGLVIDPATGKLDVVVNGYED